MKVRLGRHVLKYTDNLDKFLSHRLQPVVFPTGLRHQNIFWTLNLK